MISFLGAELHGPSIDDAGQEIVYKAENVITNYVLEQSDEEKPHTEAADNIERNQPAMCSITEDQQPNTQTHTSQRSQRTLVPGDSFLRLFTHFCINCSV